MTEALEQVFGSYFHADLLPHPLAQGLPEYYDVAANALRAYVAPEQLGDLVALLAAMRDDPSHSAVGALEEYTWFEWRERPEWWAAFRALMNALIVRLT